MNSRHQYHVRYAQTGDEFVREFTRAHFFEVYGVEPSPERLVIEFREDAALKLVNKWNRQNATSGFTYWID